MKVKRIMSNTATSDLTKAAAFYGDKLGLKLIMNHGWFQTYGSDVPMTVQVSFSSEGDSGTAVPDLSIEVDDLDAALARFNKAQGISSMGRQASRGVCGGFTFVIHSESSSISCNTSDRIRCNPGLFELVVGK